MGRLKKKYMTVVGFELVIFIINAKITWKLEKPSFSLLLLRKLIRPKMWWKIILHSFLAIFSHLDNNWAISVREKLPLLSIFEKPKRKLIFLSIWFFEFLWKFGFYKGYISRDLFSRTLNNITKYNTESTS